MFGFIQQLTFEQYYRNDINTQPLFEEKPII